MPKDLPNIILIICDTLSAKHMSLYAYERRTTPNLERLVEEGFTVYTRCFAPAPWTNPSHASLFTGLYPSEHGIDGVKSQIGMNTITLPWILKEIGYKTIGISNNLLINGQFVKGWDKFFEMDKLFQSNKTMAELNTFFHFSSNKQNKYKKILTAFKNDPISTVKFISNQLYNRKFNVLENATPFTLRTLKLFNHLINSLKTTPLFLFINLMQTHDKYHPPESVKGKFSKKLYKNREIGYYTSYDYYLQKWDNQYLNGLCSLYDEEIVFLDSVIKRILDGSKQKINNAILIISSDHGELFGEHGQVNHFFTIYNELLHVPLLIKWPDDFKIKGEIANLVQLHDLFSTILDITNSPFPKPKSSKSFLSTEKRKFAISQLLDINYKIEALKNRNPNFTPKEFMQPMMSVITDDFWKITKRLDGHIEIYNLNNDLYETTDLTEDRRYTKRVNELTSLIDLLGKITGFDKAAVKPLG